MTFYIIRNNKPSQIVEYFPGLKYYNFNNFLEIIKSPEQINKL